MNLNEIAIKVKFVEESKLKAIISLNFGEFTIKGFRVMTSEYKNCKGDKLWLIPPSYRDSAGKYHPIFFAPNKDLWKELENIIWDEYQKQQEEYYKKRFDMSKESIPIIK